jgi:hypothetical protein
MTYYAELVFLLPVGSTSHVVHSGALEARNVNILLFMLEWDWCDFHKKYARTCYVKLVFVCNQCVRGAKRHRTMFLARVGSMQFPERARQDTLR